MSFQKHLDLIGFILLAESVSKSALFEYTLMLFFVISDTKYTNVSRLLSGEQITVSFRCLSG